MIAYLYPFKQVGDFIIGSNINDYINNFEFEIKDYSENKFNPSIHYTLYNPEVTLFVKNDIIQYIGCYEELLYKGVNLIGISTAKFSSVVNTFYERVDKLDFEDDDIPQYVYEYENVGLQVWEKGKDGLIVSILVNGKDYYLD